MARQMKRKIARRVASVYGLLMAFHGVTWLTNTRETRLEGIQWIDFVYDNLTLVYHVVGVGWVLLGLGIFTASLIPRRAMEWAAFFMTIIPTGFAVVSFFIAWITGEAPVGYINIGYYLALGAALVVVETVSPPKELLTGEIQVVRGKE